MTQLTLFGDDAFDDPRPMPLRAAEQFRFDLQTCELPDGTLYYAVQDWVRGITGKNDTRSFIANIKRRDAQMLSTWQRLPYTAKDGKTYQRDYTDAEGLNSIAQRLNADTELAETLRVYLSKAGVKLDEYRRDPAQMVIEGQGLLKRRAERYIAEGRAPEWAGSRGLGIMSHAAFKAELYRVCPEIRFGMAINTEYRGLFGSTAAQLREQRGIAKRGDTRDGLTLSELHLLGWVEAQVSELFAGQDNAPEDECLRVIEDIANRARTLIGGAA